VVLLLVYTLFALGVTATTITTTVNSTTPSGDPTTITVTTQVEDQAQKYVLSALNLLSWIRGLSYLRLFQKTRVLISLLV
jgi:glutamine cyclotransferase